jgi:hypothetical protein
VIYKLENSSSDSWFENLDNAYLLINEWTKEDMHRSWVDQLQSKKILNGSAIERSWVDWYTIPRIMTNNNILCVEFIQESAFFSA